jgi:plastocyanin
MKRVAAALLCVASVGCGGGSSPSAPAPTPNNPYTFTITSSGVLPKELTVPQGTRVLFVNNDSRRHDMASDQHPDHLECPPINNVGALNPGQSRETGNMNVIRSCGFHDHDNPTTTSLQGRIITR